MYAKRMTSELARLSVMIGFLSSFETYLQNYKDIDIALTFVAIVIGCSPKRC